MSNVIQLLAAAARREESGDKAGAIEMYRKVLALQPRHAQASRRLGGVLADAGRFDEALAIASDAAGVHAGDAALTTMLARCLFETGRPELAKQAAERALQIDPGSKIARVWLARCMTALHRGPDALALLATLNNDVDAMSASGEARRMQGQLPEALACYQAALKSKETAAARRDVALCLIDVGRAAEALPHCDRAVELDPSMASAWGARAAAQQAMGDSAAARATVEVALARGQRDATMLGIYARACVSAPEHRAKAIGVIESLLPGVATDSMARTTLLYALGTLKDAAADYDGAFACFREANDRIPSTFDVAAYGRAVQELLGTFSAAGMAEMARASNRDERPVFIVGMPRSGSTLVEQILAGHPDIHGGGELPDMPELITQMPRKLGVNEAFPKCWPSLSASQLDEIAAEYLRRLEKISADKPGAKRITDKMLSNILLLGPIYTLFPKARIVHCTRDALDTCVSCYMTPLSQMYGYRTRFATLAGAYKVYEGAAAHWRNLVPMLEVKYEDVIANPESSARRIVEFIGLPWDDRCARPHETKRVANTASIDQVKKPVYNSSVGRWKRYERHLGELIESLRAQHVL